MCGGSVCSKVPPFFPWMIFIYFQLHIATHVLTPHGHSECLSVCHVFDSQSVSHAIGTQCQSVSHAFGTENISVLSTCSHQPQLPSKSLQAPRHTISSLHPQHQPPSLLPHQLSHQISHQISPIPHAFLAMCNY